MWDWSLLAWKLHWAQQSRVEAPSWREMAETTRTTTQNAHCTLWPVQGHMEWLAMLYKVHFDEVHVCEQKQ